MAPMPTFRSRWSITPDAPGERRAVSAAGKAKRKWLAALLICSVAGICYAGDVKVDTASPLDEGATFASPGGVRVATFTGAGFEIRESATSKVSVVHSLPPVFQAVWMQDSRTLLTLEHVAGGTCAVCFHLGDHGDWVRIPTAPPLGPYQSYIVKRWTFDKSGIRITYATRSRREAVLTTSEVSFDLDPQSGAVTHLTSVKTGEEPLR